MSTVSFSLHRVAAFVFRVVSSPSPFRAVCMQGLRQLSCLSLWVRSSFDYVLSHLAIERTGETRFIGHLAAPCREFTQGHSFVLARPAPEAKKVRSGSDLILNLLNLYKSFWKILPYSLPVVLSTLGTAYAISVVVTHAVRDREFYAGAVDDRQAIGLGEFLIDQWGFACPQPVIIPETLEPVDLLNCEAEHLPDLNRGIVADHFLHKVVEQVMLKVDRAGSVAHSNHESFAPPNLIRGCAVLNVLQDCNVVVKPLLAVGKKTAIVWVLLLNKNVEYVNVFGIVRREYEFGGDCRGCTTGEPAKPSHADTLCQPL